MIEIEGPGLEVFRLRKELRDLSHETLAMRPDFETMVRKFRGTPVCIAVAKVVGADDSIVFLIRGFIPQGRGVQEASFAKNADSSRRDAWPDELAALRAIIRQRAALGIGP